MGCFYPLPATLLPGGGSPLIHKRTPGMPVIPTPAGLGRDIKLPCNNCLGCRMERTQQWATRCLHESQQHQQNCFLTLTIADEYMERIAPGGSLSKLQHRKFMRRYRATVGSKARFYMCGEYGERLKRPHYHYLIFGHNFSDKLLHKTSDSGEKLYTSPTLNRIWPYGKAWIGEVTYESCAYVAAYVMKKLNGPMAENHYRRVDEAGNEYWLQPEFNLMSRRPGIGKTWWDQYNADLLVDDLVVRPGGSKIKTPRYYDKLLELMDPVQLEVLKLKRELRAKELTTDNTPARLADKETVAKAKLSIKKRQLEHL